MRLPFVSRERYDELAQRYAALEARYDALVATFRDQYRTAPRPAGPPRQARPAHDPVVDALAADLGQVIADPAAARAEAERIKREAFGGAL